MYKLLPPAIICYFLFVSCYAAGQPKLNYVKKLLHPDNDTVIYSFTNLEGRKFDIPLSVKKIASGPDKLIMMNNNNEGWLNTHIYKTKKDSITLKARREETFVIKATNGKDTIAIYANFINAYPKYTSTYIREHAGVVSVEIPKVFELVNIIFALSDSGKANGNLVLKGTKYYTEVINYFSGYDRHPIVEYVNTRLRGGNKMAAYIDARTHAMGYEMTKHTIHADEVYPERWGQNFWTGKTALLQDFAFKTKYASFYKAHQSYYDSLILLQKKYLPAIKMWHWLEKEFPEQYQSYKIIFSPLVNGAHNTERFAVNDFSEILMYINGPERLQVKDEKLPEGMMSGILFTEIDHNYVNPVSDRYQKEIRKIFSNRGRWAGKGGDAGFYNSELSVFNEYMTHALFLVYAYVHYDPATFKLVNDAREELMISHRKFIYFKQFNDKLRELYLNRQPGETIAALYPAILNWAGNIE